MQRRPYGKTGYDVSLMGMGCMRLPRTFNGGRAEVDLEKAFEMIRYAAEHGVDYFDTAFGYHNQTSEAVLGEALAGGLREKVKIVTKLPPRESKTAGDMRNHLENTLKKLRTDYLDVYLVHGIGASSWEDVKRREIFKEYEKFKAEGLIKAIGFSYHGGPAIFKEMLAEYPWEMCMVQQNLLDVDKEVTAAAIAAAGEKGCALAVMEPLRGGGLATAPKSVQALYESHPVKRTPVEWAFYHLINYPQISVIISGMSSLEQIKENIEIFSGQGAKPNCLSDQDKELLAKVRAAYDSMQAIPCTACEYCMPCKQNVAIAAAFTQYNDGVKFENFDQPRRSYWFGKTALGIDAGRCTECGECSPKCPQGLDIPSQLKVARKALDGWVE
jgi:predicted aldo/keto reductase-like oxidoreductase